MLTGFRAAELISKNNLSNKIKYGIMLNKNIMKKM